MTSPPDLGPLRRVPIEQVLADRGICLRRRGRCLVGPCPIHGGDNPGAFVVSPDKNLWHCFTRCGGGNVIDLVLRLDRKDWRSATAYLASLAGAAPLPVPAPAPAMSAAATPFRPYTRTLHLDPGDDFLNKKAIHPETARRFEVGRYHGKGFLAGCVAVRLHDPEGRPLGYAGRRLDPEAARRLGKWKLPPRLPKRRILYNYHRVQACLASAGVILVECPWGVLRLAQLRVPAVALLGTTLSEPQARLLRRARRIGLLLDADPAGRRAEARICTLLADHSPTILRLPDRLDPDDLTDPDHSAILRPLLPF